MKRLKEALWHNIQQLRQWQQGSDGAEEAAGDGEQQLRFRDVISMLGEGSGAGRLADLSVHLCFICLLHLANEHGLAIQDATDLAQLTISNIPAR